VKKKGKKRDHISWEGLRRAAQRGERKSLNTGIKVKKGEKHPRDIFKRNKERRGGSFLNLEM